MATSVMVPTRGGRAQVIRIPNQKPTKRRSNGAAKKALEKSKKSAALARKKAREVKESVGTKGLLYAGGGFTTGIVASGVMDAMGVDDIFGFDGRLVIGGAAIAAAFLMDIDPWWSLALGTMGLGVAAPAVAELFDEAITSYFAS